MIAAEGDVEGGEVVFCTGSGEKVAMRLCVGYNFNFVVVVLKQSLTA